ncbi:unnamed protein product [Oikopleura dioica]|uniref:Uncharacterized protein n=1 Tax=Oikopleura dioica TaxID=34765 RepID=E4XJ12_OIKDI|nr:unnamed protein product [Oikopleura dioica]
MSISIIRDTCDDVINSNPSAFDNYQLRLCNCTLENTTNQSTEKLPVAFRMIPTNNYAVSWAWASLMLHLCITGFFALMWIHHVTPAVTPPYNKAVLAIFLCLLGLIIIDCCGMSKYIVRDNAHPTASASLCFNMFLLFLGAYLAMGAYQERDPNAFASQQFN